MSMNNLVVLMKRHVIIRHVNMMLLQVILMIVQEIFMMNIKMKKMTITLTLHLKKMIQLNRNYKKKSEIGYYPKKITQSNQIGYA